MFIVFLAVGTLASLLIKRYVAAVASEPDVRDAMLSNPGSIPRIAAHSTTRYLRLLAAHQPSPDVERLRLLALMAVGGTFAAFVIAKVTG